VAIIALAVLMFTKTIEPEQGLPGIIYLTGYSVGGTYGPAIRRTTDKD
jgi:hypothetical protein